VSYCHLLPATAMAVRQVTATATTYRWPIGGSNRAAEPGRKVPWLGTPPAPAAGLSGPPPNLSRENPPLTEPAAAHGLAPVRGRGRDSHGQTRTAVQRDVSICTEPPSGP
jgi:hypothetical protein